MTEAEERATFEAWAIANNHYLAVDSYGAYHSTSARVAWIAWQARAALSAPPVPINLNIIRKWPDGFGARLEHVWLDVVGFIPEVKLGDLQRTLAEFGFTMVVYAAPSPQEQTP